GTAGGEHVDKPPGIADEPDLDGRADDGERKARADRHTERTEVLEDKPPDIGGWGLLVIPRIGVDERLIATKHGCVPKEDFDEMGPNAQPETALPVQRVVCVPLVLIERSSFTGRWR